MPKKRKRPKSQTTSFRATRKEIEHYRTLAKKSNLMWRYLGDNYFGRRSINVSTFKSRSDFLFETRRLERRTALGTRGYRTYRNEIFKQNYLTHLKKYFGSRIDNKTLQRIQNADPNKFYKFYQTNTLESIYKFNYNEDIDATQEELETLIKQLNLATDIFGKA